MKIPEIISLIAKCWEHAEKSLQSLIETRYPDKDEEFITELFHGELKAVIDKANEKGMIRDAFINDVMTAFPEISYSRDLNLIAEKIRATTVFHNRKLEKKTGGDLGIVFVRPNLIRSFYDKTTLIIEHEYQRGLLAQVKLKSRKTTTRGSRWGKLTTNQMKVLSEQLGHLSLVLYEYSDKERYSLLPFQWQLCNYASMEEIEKWLKRGVFPSLKKSCEIIRLLGNDQIGTGDKRIIKDFVCPDVRNSLKIHIGWPPDNHSLSKIVIREKIHNKQHVNLIRCVA